MIARVLLLLLAVQVALFAALGAWLLPACLRWPALVLCAVAGVVAVRAVVVAASFAVAWVHRTPRTSEQLIGPARAVALYVRETAAQVLVFAILQPFVHWFAPADDVPRQGARSMPVLLIPGLFCNGAIWWRFARRLRAAGVDSLCAITLEPPLLDLDALADRLAARIEIIVAATQSARVALVTHSMGGLIVRAYLRKYGDARTATLITLGAPHRGTVLARFSFGRCVRQMLPGNPWLSELAQSEPTKPRFPALAIYSAHDNIVVPQANGRLDGAQNVSLVGVGHVELLFRREVCERVLAHLRAAPTMR
jgi:predicted alpha/beta hydrolase family esterase